MVDDATLRSELIALRGQRGMVAGATERCVAWLELLGVTPDELDNRIRDELEAMPQNREVLALRSAMGIDYGHLSTLLSRREKFASDYDPHDPPSVEAMKAWDEKALKELMVRLQSGRRKPQPVKLVVRGEVDDNRAVSAVIGVERGRDFEKYEYILGNVDGHPSVPALLFYKGLAARALSARGRYSAEGWNVEHLYLMMHFKERPSLAWANSAQHLNEVLVGRGRHLVDVGENRDGTYSTSFSWGTPSDTAIYCLAWQY